MCKSKRNKYGRLVLLLSVIAFVNAQQSCNKYLDKKPSQDLAVPTTLKEFQAILDNANMNGGSPGYMEFVADNYYLTTPSWNSALIAERTSYIWDANANPNPFSTWNPSYENIYNANFVLDYLPGITISNAEKDEFNRLLGSAYFFRGFMFHQVAQLFCKPYSNSANTDQGIVLRTTSAVEQKSTRSTVQQTYDRLIADLKIAAVLLPKTTLFPTRPNKAAAYGELARVYLSMRQYETAKLYADSALGENASLLDYNSLAPGYSIPSFLDNPEILSVSRPVAPYDQLNAPQGIIDTSLYRSYDDNDLRKQAFFEFNTSNSTYHFRGSYFPENGTYSINDGVSIDEIYLIKAECEARGGNKDDAMETLNTLLSKRWKTGTFTGLTAATAEEAVDIILAERRKELLYRGLRWSDLRRLNLEGAGIELKRVVNNTTYPLPPNDLRWVLLIPDIEIARSGIQQNPR